MFKRDEHKWAAFKLKIMAIEPQSEVNDVDPRRARHVLHVKCGKSIVMSMPYDISLYKRHVQNCKSRTANAGMHTLDNSLNFILPLQVSGSSSANSGICDNSTALWPCPGLSEEDDPLIDNYLHQTTVSLAGGISMDAIAEQMYKSPYKELADDQKQSVRVGQVHTHRLLRLGRA